MHYLIYSFLFIFLLISCNVEGVKEDGKVKYNQLQLENEVEVQLDETVKKEAADSIPSQSEETVVLNEKVFENGIKIKWISKGEGQSIKENDMIAIDYRNSLEDGTVYDGNHFIKKPFVPFLVGWNLQTKGWDFALTQLKVGDEVEVFLPAEWARGEKGIPGIVPPNVPNILYINVLKVIEPTFLVDDIRIWRVEESKNPSDSISFEDELKIHYFASSKSKPRYDNSYERGAPFSLTMGDGNIVPGLYKALHFGRKGDKLMVHIPAKEAYGSKGLTGLVKPNEDLFFDLIILEHEKN